MIKRSGTYELEVRDQMKGGPGSVTLEKYFTPEEFGGKHVRVCSKLILRPGSGIGLHPHEAEDEVYIVLRGRGRVNDGGTVTEIGVGDSVLTGRGASHSVECLGDETLEILALVITY